MIEMFLTALPSLKIELQIDVATVLGWCAVYRVMYCHVCLQLQLPYSTHLLLHFCYRSVCALIY